MSRKITKNWHLELAIDFRNLDRGSFRKEKQKGEAERRSRFWCLEYQSLISDHSLLAEWFWKSRTSGFLSCSWGGADQRGPDSKSKCTV